VIVNITNPKQPNAYRAVYHRVPRQISRNITNSPKPTTSNTWNGRPSENAEAKTIRAHTPNTATRSPKGETDLSFITNLRFMVLSIPKPLDQRLHIPIHSNVRY
jgi:hypothetical protein